jgi:hypothetical protein
MLEVDHVFVLVDDGAAAAARAQAAGWVLDDGIAHEGQGSRNRRLWLEDQYLELLWVHDRAEAAANPLRLDRRADWRTTGASPFGFALRGEIRDKQPFWPYRPSFAQGETIWILRAPEEEPLVFAFEGVRGKRPAPRNAAALRSVRVAAPVALPLVLATVDPAVTWRPAETPHLDVVVGGGAARHEISELCAIVG